MSEGNLVPNLLYHHHLAGFNQLLPMLLPSPSLSSSSSSDHRSPSSPTAKIVSPSNDSRGLVAAGGMVVVVVDFATAAPDGAD